MAKKKRAPSNSLEAYINKMQRRIKPLPTAYARPFVSYCDEGDAIEAMIERESYVAQWISPYLTIYTNHRRTHIVGVRVEGVRHLLKNPRIDASAMRKEAFAAERKFKATMRKTKVRDRASAT